MNPNFQPSFMDYPKTLGSTKNLYLKTDLGVLDIMSELPPVGDFQIIKKNATQIQIFGKVCSVISLDDLIKIKKSMTRPKDKETLQQLLKIKQQSEPKK